MKINLKSFFQAIMLVAILHSSFILPAQNTWNAIQKIKSNQPLNYVYLGEEIPGAIQKNEISKLVQQANSKQSENISVVLSPTFETEQQIGIIGVSTKNPIDDPSDNIFSFEIPKTVQKNDRVFLSYDLYGVQDHNAVSRSINERLAVGGYLISENNSWSKQVEEIDVNWLKYGTNTVMFTTPQGADYSYKIKNLKVEVIKQNTNLSSQIVLQDSQITIQKDNKIYLKGFVKSNDSKDVKVTAEGQSLEVRNGEFEGFVQLDKSIKNKKQIQITAYDSQGLIGQEVVFLDLQNQAQKLLTIEPLVNFQSKLFKASISESLSIPGASISVPENVLTTDQQISIIRLRNVDLPPLADGMINVTKGGKGYRFLPDGIQFSKPVQLSLAYDSILLPKGYEPKDIKTFYFDVQRKKWVIVKTDTIDYKNQMVTALTTHFTDYINGVIQVPESPQTNAFVPTMMNDIKAADPSSEITLISPPSASQKGSVSVGYPIKIPAGRLGMQPNIGLQYSNEGGNGWLGLGWNINTPAITLDTRWGVPVFDPTNETEMYQLNGEALMYPKDGEEDWMPNRHIGDYGNGVVQVKAMPRGSSDKIFTPRKQGSFAKIERIGNLPSNYYWKVTETNGTVHWYGGGPNGFVENSIIRNTPNISNTLGNIVHWALYMTVDVYGNYVKYEYVNGSINSNVNDNLNGGQFFYLDKIRYTGTASGSSLTDGKYVVSFIKQNKIKSDVSINGRLGYKQVDPYLLDKIEITDNTDNTQKRTYQFRYKKVENDTVGIGGGRFGKNLLESVAEQMGTGAALETFYEHTFEYYDDLLSEDGKSVKYFSEATESKICNDTYVPGNVSNGDNGGNTGNNGGTNNGGNTGNNGNTGGTGTSCPPAPETCYTVKLPRNYKETPLYKYDSGFISMTKHDASCNPFYIKVSSLIKNGVTKTFWNDDLATSFYNNTVYVDKCQGITSLIGNSFNAYDTFNWKNYFDSVNTTVQNPEFSRWLIRRLGMEGLTLKNASEDIGIVASVDNYSGVSNSLFFGNNNSAKVQNRAAFRAKFFTEENMDVAMGYKAYNNQSTPVFDFEFVKKFQKSGPYPIGTSVSADVVVKTCKASYNFGTYQLADTTDLRLFKERIVAQFPNSQVTVYQDYNFVNISISNPKEEFFSVELIGKEWRSDYPFRPCYNLSNPLPPAPAPQQITEERTKYPPTNFDIEYAIAHWIAAGNELNEPIPNVPIDIMVDTKGNPVHPEVTGSYQFIFENNQARWLDENGALVTDSKTLEVLKTVTPDVNAVQQQHQKQETEKRKQQQIQAQNYLSNLIKNKKAPAVKITPNQNVNTPVNGVIPPPGVVAGKDLIPPPAPTFLSIDKYKEFFSRFFKNNYSFVPTVALPVVPDCNPYTSNEFILSGLNSPNYNFSSGTLGSSKSVSISAGIYGGVGIGFSRRDRKDKLITVGLQYNRSWGYNESDIALVDINGDGLEDQIVKLDDLLYYKTHTVNRTYNDKNEPVVTHDFGPKRPILGLSEFYFSKTKGNNFNFQISFGYRRFSGSVGRDYSNNTSEVEVYFTDANADGLIDIAYNGKVWFNYLDANGNPNFTLDSAQTENMLITASAREVETPAVTDENAYTQPSYDVVKVWQAPTDGVVAIDNVITNTDTKNDAQLTVEWAKKVEDKNCYTASFNAPGTKGNTYFYYWTTRSSRYGYFNCLPFSSYIESAEINNVLYDRNNKIPNNLFVAHGNANGPINQCVPLNLGEKHEVLSSDFVFRAKNVFTNLLREHYDIIRLDLTTYVYSIRSDVAGNYGLIGNNYEDDLGFTFRVSSQEIINSRNKINSIVYNLDDPEERYYVQSGDLSMGNYVEPVNYDIYTKIYVNTSKGRIYIGEFNFFERFLQFNHGYTGENDPNNPTGFIAFERALKQMFPNLDVTANLNYEKVSIGFNNSSDDILSIDFEHAPSGTIITYPFIKCDQYVLPPPPSSVAQNWEGVKLSAEEEELGLMKWKAEGNELKLPMHEVPLNVFVDANNNTINPTVKGYYTFTKDKASTKWNDNKGNVITDANVIAVLQQLLPADADSMYQQNQVQFQKQEQAQREKSQQEAIAFLQERAEKLKKILPPPPSPTQSLAEAVSCEPTYEDPCLLYGIKLASNQTLTNTITNSAACGGNNIQVKKGDKIYFRLHAKPMGNPIVNWEPTVRYTDNVNASLVDQNNLSAFNSSYKDSYLVSSFNGELDFMETGTATVNWDQITVANNVLSDDVRFEIIKTRIYIDDNGAQESEAVVWSYPISANGGTLPKGMVTVPLTVGENELYSLKFKVTATSNVNWNLVKWNPVVNFKSTKDVTEDGVKLGNLNRNEDFYPIVDYTVYSPYTCKATPLLTQPLNNATQLTLTPNLNAFPKGDYGLVHLVAKSNQKLLGKVSFNITSSSVSLVSGSATSITLPANTANVEYSLNLQNPLERNESVEFLFDKLTPSMVVANLSNGVTVTASQVHCNQNIEGPFGKMYRNWGQFLYNPNLENKGKPLGNGLVGELINEAAFKLSEEYKNKLKNSLGETNVLSSFGIPSNFGNDSSETVEISEDSFDTFKNNNQDLFKNRALIPLRPSKQTANIELWIGEHEYNFVSATQMSAQTLDAVIEEILQEPDSETQQANLNTRAYAINKLSKGKSNNFSGGVWNFNYNRSWDGVNNTLSDYVDINGDRYPDIVTKNDVQFTNATGGLKLKSDRFDKLQPSYSESNSKGIGASGTFGQAGQSTSSPSSTGGNAKRNDSESGDSAGNISGSLNFGNSNAKVMFVDVNGDGLSDVVDLDNNIAKLNITPTVGSTDTPWNKLRLFASENNSVSLGLGANWRQASRQAGVSVSSSKNNTLSTFVDVNGDGLPDLVEQFNPDKTQAQQGQLPKLTVSYNNGNAFAEPIEMPDFSLNNESISSSEAGNAGFTYSLMWKMFFKLYFKISANIKGSADRSLSNTNKLITDFDGDGYPDLVERLGFWNLVKVQHSRIRRTNMLKSVTNPLGGKFTVDYQVSPVTYDNPHPKWVMSEVVVEDGVNHPYDGSDKMIQRFEYENARYDRREREFYGFETVKTKDIQIDEQGKPQGVYRTSVTQYHNRSYFLNGMVKEQVVYAAEDTNARFNRTENTYGVYAINKDGLLDLNNKKDLKFDVGGTQGRKSAGVVLESSKTFIYEKSNTPIQAEQRFDYDNYARITKVTNIGDPNNNEDNYTTDIAYFTDDELASFGIKDKNIIGLAKSISVKDAASKLRRFRENKQIDAFGKPQMIASQVKEGEQAEVKLEYYTNGNLKKIIYPTNHKGEQQAFTYTYDSVHQKMVTGVTDFAGFNSTGEYNLFTDKVLKSTDISGKIMSYAYDKFGRLTTIKAPNESISNRPYTISFSYYPTHNALPQSGVPSKGNISKTDFVPFAITRHFDVQRPSDPIETITFTDGLARPIQVKKDIFYNEAAAMSVSGISTLDAFGRAVKQHHPYFQPKNVSGASNYILYKELNPTHTAVATTIYDELDRAIESVDFEGNKSFTEYSLATDVFGNRSLKEKVTVPNGANTIISENYKDPTGRVNATMQVDAGKNITTRFVYNSIGELQSYTNALNQTTIYEYDRLGRKTKRTNPDSGVTVYEYDKANNLVTLETANLRPKGQKINYEYDYAGRLLKEIYPKIEGVDNLINVIYTYGSTGAPAEQKGRLIKVQDATGTQEFVYGNMGEVKQNTRVINTPHPGQPERRFITQYEYDSFNRMLKLTYPDGEAVNYSYDLGGKLTKMSGKPSESATAYDYISKVNYDYFENRTMVTYGNGVSTTYDYTKENQRLNKIITQTGSSVLRSHQYTYDKVGNITQVVNPVAAVGQIGGSFTHNYTYDNLNRLKTANGSFTASAGEQNALNDKSSAYNLTMTYDEIHRITKKEQQHTKNANNTAVFENSYTNNYTYYAGKNWVSQVVDNRSHSNHGYDLNGNMNFEEKFVDGNAIGIRRMFWDENNRLRAVKDGGLLHHYIYDATGERVLKGSSQYSAAYENGLQVKSSITFNQYVLYPSAFMVLSPTGYTKHYYNGGERVVSAIGSQDIGIYNTGNVASKGKTANGLKTAQRQDLEQLAKEAEITSVTFKEPSNNSAELEEENPIGISAKGLSVSNTANVPKVYFYHSDHLGTNSYITNASATAVQFYVNLPFGETMVEHRNTNSEYLTDYLFTGHELDRETNLYYAHARYLNPRLGVWLSVDPKAADAPGWSPYRAFFCNPIRYTDPDGQWEWDATGNLVAQKGDNSYSMAKFLGTSQSNAMQMLNRGGVTANAKGVLNLKEGQSFAKGSLWVGTKSASGPVVNNTAEATAHYFNGNGAAADVGDQSTRELLSSPEFTKAHSRITNGLSESDHGFVKVDMEFSTFHIGTTQFKYDVSSNGNSNAVTYKLFYSNVWGSDGFWDPDYIDENTLGKIPYVRDWTGTKPDGPGPNLERGGTPYFYKTRDRTYFYKPPVEEQK